MNLRPVASRHDLPPRWDGLVVVWGEWQSARSSLMFHLPLRDQACRLCGSLDPGMVAWGAVALRPEITREQIEGARRMRKGGRYALMRLIVHRCSDCRVDVVHDQETDEWWTLDESDYADEGSVDPRPPTLF